MASATLSPIHRQVSRVSRRLFLQTLLDGLAWCWAGAFLLAALWFLADPFVPGARADGARWAVAGGLFGAASLLAVVLAAVRAPSRLTAALSLDERFGLKERVTTSLTLAPEFRALPAAQALLEDANQRVARLDVGEGFPMQVRWTAALVPLGALLLAAVAVFYDPPRGQATPPTEDPLALAPLNKKEIDDTVKQLKEKREKKAAEKGKPEKIDPLDDELKNILNKPKDTQEEVRDRVKELTKLEDQMKSKQDALAEKNQAMKEQMQQMNKMAGMDPKEGPAKDLQKAVEKGDFNKAREEVERLAKKMEQGELSEKEKEQLRKQVEKMKEQMRAMADPKLAEEKLQELKREGKIDQQQFDKAMEQVKKNASQMSPDDQKKMEELADALKQCAECMKSGDGDKAADALRKAGQAMRKMDDLDQLNELDQQLDELREAKRCMCRGMSGQAGIGEGKRPEGEAHDTRSYTTRIKGDFDPKGQKELTGFAPGQAYKKKSSAEIAGEIKQSGQEAPEAIERTRIPRAASDMARGYFENFRKRGSNEEEKK